MLSSINFPETESTALFSNPSDIHKTLVITDPNETISSIIFSASTETRWGVEMTSEGKDHNSEGTVKRCTPTVSIYSHVLRPGSEITSTSISPWSFFSCQCLRWVEGRAFVLSPTWGAPASCVWYRGHIKTV